MKIHNRIIYILITIFVLYTLLFSGFIYYSISNYAFTDFHKRLEIRAATNAKIKLEHKRESDILRELRQEYLEILPNEKEYYIELKNGIYAKESISKNIPHAFVKGIINKGSASYSNGNIYYSGIRYITSSQEDYVVIVSAENYFHSHHIAYLRNLLFTSLVYAFLLIILISFIFTRTLIRPIKNIINAVNDISSENLHLRLSVPARNDSLSQLISTFNNMLDRLETSFETQKNFISNASHELNTPLTSIIGEGEVALSKPRKPAEYRETINIILEQAGKLEQKTKALLYMARTGYDGKKQKFEKLRIDELILDVKNTTENLLGNVNVSIDFSLLPESPLKLKIKGNEQLLHLALCNIVMNACKYSNSQPVNIAIASDDEKVIVIIKDNGIGIPEEEMKFIYDPFFRASNTTQYEGYGIGLPLARNIIKIHNGTLLVSSVVDQGTTVRVNLPLGNYTF